MSVHALDFGQELRLAALKVFVSKTPVIGRLGFQLGVNPNSIRILELSKGLKVELL